MKWFYGDIQDNWSGGGRHSDSSRCPDSERFRWKAGALRACDYGINAEQQRREHNGAAFINATIHNSEPSRGLHRPCADK